MIEYIIIAILQGFFEWLPISSSGQVMIVSIAFFGISPTEAFSLAIWLHMGTMLAVLLKYRTDYSNIIKSLFLIKKDYAKKTINERNWLIIATIGTAITALPLYFLFKTVLEDYFRATQGDIITLIIAGLLIITGFLILLTKKVIGKKTVEDLPEKIFQSDSLISGLAQGVSILPGVSRSGVTVSSILLQNYTQDNALKLSFLISVPAVIGSVVADIVFGSGSVFFTLDISIILISTGVSFIVGYLSIEGLLKLAKRINFGYFCITYGLIAFVIILPFLLVF
ncbi:MAG: Undecaprenyl-diphosphatase [Promethearchaeota archaeon]|nr:MAG: Undecaprenyl-diphosphatase [Candidatus Lokiarchaeota archaeon]